MNQQSRRNLVLEQVRNQVLWAPLRMLESDHKSLLLQIRDLQGIFQRWCSRPFGRWSEEEKSHVRAWLEQHRLHLTPHFEAEETTIFPYLAGHAPELKAILTNLTVEHQAIRRWSLAIEAAFQALCNGARPDQPAAFFCRRALATLRLIERHVLQEQRLLESGGPGVERKA